jgi:hypothetical protein
VDGTGRERPQRLQGYSVREWQQFLLRFLRPPGRALVIMSDNEADRFRKQAEEATEQAAKAFSPLDKAVWVAEEWLKLASSVESRPK